MNEKDKNSNPKLLVMMCGLVLIVTPIVTEYPGRVMLRVAPDSINITIDGSGSPEIEPRR